MKPELTPEEIARRFADIDSRPPETLTPGEEASLAMAMEDDSAPVSLDAFRQDLEEYSGKLVLRIPRSLHKALKEAADPAATQKGGCFFHTFLNIISTSCTKFSSSKCSRR